VGAIEHITEGAVDPKPAAIGRDESHPHAGVLEGAVELVLAFPASPLSRTALGDLGAQLDLGHHRSGQILEQSDIPLGPEPRRLIDHAEAANHLTFTSDQRDAGV
jgi:hypothetical protein